MRIIALSAISLLMLVVPAYGGAWTQNGGEGLAILTTSYYDTDRYYDNKGHKQSQPDYSQYALNPYVEYGLWDGLTVGTNLSLQYVHQNASPGGAAQANYGLGDSEFFVRQLLWQADGFVVSAEPMVKLPSPESSTAQPEIGSSSPDVGMGLSAGYGFSAYGQNHFLDLDSQYRYRFGNPTNQVRLDATAGIGITPRMTLMPQLFLTYRTSAPTMARFLQSPADDYNMVKLQLSATYQWRNDIKLQAGGFTIIDGKNTGSGSGVLLAMWKAF